ncbi:heme peroxidase, partial [Mycotypha africana]|uniref:heme peroxidase n=1 Tax=Mycotypha africana TaxID=64632 RepID=UPI0023016290
YLIKEEKDVNNLLKHFEVLGDDINRTKDSISKENYSKRSQPHKVPPAPSSNPVGLAWKLDALVKNIKAILRITPTNKNALESALRLPFRDKLLLLSAVVEQLLSNNAPINDRNNTLETVINILREARPEDKDFNDIPKPFHHYAGHQFRSADGSGNSLLFPDVGKAGTYYSKTVFNSTRDVMMPLPDPKELFDRLLRRPEGVFRKHPENFNMLLFHFGTLLTHDFFHTDPKNPAINLTTSYIDMSFLYGTSREAQESVRQMKGGLLKPDQWWDRRFLLQPPGVSALLVMFSRNHNYIARKLLEHNENGRFSYGPKKALCSPEEQDEELFQTARIINNACYLRVITHDYVRNIVGSKSSASFVFIDTETSPTDPLYGNAVSFEFNIVYRWHAAIGQEDTQWLNKVYKVLYHSHAQRDATSCNKLATKDDLFDNMLQLLNREMIHATPKELERGYPIVGTHRRDDGTFPDTDLVTFLKNDYHQMASELGNGRNIPAALEHVEIAGILQARKLNLCTFNDFRRHFNLMALRTFEDFSENVEVQKALEELYGTPENVELYVGLLIERARPSGIHFPYTMGRAILTDAANIVKNDRHFMKELTPINLTNWGYKYAAGDPKDYDRMLPTLLTTLFPHAAPGVVFSGDALKEPFKVPTH